MKLSLSIKIIVTLSIILLCAGVAIYSFMRLHSEEQRKDFNLYTLVPQNAIAIFETDRMVNMLESMEQMECCQDGHFLQISDLFGCMKTYLHNLIEETPHALSQQMNKVLISFHTPNNQTNQVIYCTLGTGDRELLEHFIEKYCSASFPVKSFDYKGEIIRIYPMNNGHFLAICLNRDFLILSFQKKLLEQVIDTYHEKDALLDAPLFRSLHNDKLRNVEASLYLRTRTVPMGLSNDTLHPTLNMGEWMKFDMKFTTDAIYCTGISQDTDTTQNFLHDLRTHKVLSGFCEKKLPASTFLYNYCSIFDQDSLFTLSLPQHPIQIHKTNFVTNRDCELLDFLRNHTDNNALSCFFLARHQKQAIPCAVISIPLNTNEWEAQQHLLEWLHNTPHEKNAPSTPRFHPGYDSYPCSQAFRKYLLPRNTLVTRLTGFTHTSLYSYACFYRGNLLLAPDAFSLSAYIDALEHKDLLEGNPHYEALAESLAPTYNFLLMANMEEVLLQPTSYARMLPSFFLSNADFFRHFVLAAQFNNHDSIICPNLTLLYKPSIPLESE